ncbi:hypothetical protein ACHAQH_009642 [Verticillium albo-atrum]
MSSGMSSGWYSEYSSPLPAAEDFAHTVAELWKPYIHSLHNSSYTTKSGSVYNIDPSNRQWDQSLGKDVLILDVDTRFDNPGHVSVLDKKNLNARRAGRLNHYIYALIHGYDYRFMHAPKYWYRHQTWVKVPMMKEALKKYKFVVFLDADAIFTEPQLPLEWLMSLWNIHDETLLAMAEDLDVGSNYDKKGWLLWNTGFVIAQQSERTQKLFKSWIDCPSDAEYPGCSHWSYHWAHEQAAFGNYLRYDYNTSDQLRMLPCMHANGSPYIPENNTCGGVFVSHLWSEKWRAIEDLREMVTTGLMRKLNEGKRDEVFEAFVNPIRNHWIGS